MAKNDFDDFSNIGRSSSAEDYGLMEDGKKKKLNFRSGVFLTLFIALIWLPVIVILVTFALINHSDGGGLITQEPIFRFVAILLVSVFSAVTLIIVLIWKKYGKIRARFESFQQPWEKELEKDTFVPLVPISFDGEYVRIIYMYKLHEFKINDILWVHHYETHTKNGHQFSIAFHDYKGKNYTALVNGKKTIASARIVLDNILNSANHMLVSEGFLSKTAKQCKKEYKQRVNGNM